MQLRLIRGRVENYEHVAIICTHALERHTACLIVCLERLTACLIVCVERLTACLIVCVERHTAFHALVMVMAVMAMMVAIAKVMLM